MVYHGILKLVNHGATMVKLKLVKPWYTIVYYGTVPWYAIVPYHGNYGNVPYIYIFFFSRFTTSLLKIFSAIYFPSFQVAIALPWGEHLYTNVILLAQP